MCVSLFFFFQQEMLYFAIDKVNLKIDTPDRKNPLHETVTVACQNERNKKDESNLAIVQNSKSESRKSKDPIYKVSYCQPPNRTIQTVKIMFHCVQLIKSNFSLACIKIIKLCNISFYLGSA